MSAQPNFKKYISVSNIMVLAIIFFLIYAKYPQIKENLNSQGQAVVETFNLTDIRTNESIQLPAQQKQIVVFWATWCGPCKVELSRLQRLVQNQTLKPHQVLAISLDESEIVVTEFLKTNKYDFLVAYDKNSLVSQKFNVLGTPTILLINENNKVEWRTTGISPTLEARVLSFF